MAEGECYVCAESSGAPRLSQCACKGRYIHDGCLEKLVRTQKVAICMVCKEPYANVSVRTRYRRVWGSRYGTALVFGAYFALFLVIGAACFVLYATLPAVRMVMLALGVLCFAMTSLACAVIGVAVGFGGGFRRVRSVGMHRVSAEVTITR